MPSRKKTILVTGSAGFIGAELSIELIKRGEFVIGVDNLNNYYNPNLKRSRLERIEQVAKSSPGKFINFQEDIKNSSNLNKIFEKYSPSIVVNLAAQAGVRYSIENPGAYIESNLVGFANILEACRFFSVKNLIYASSSSVYGGNSNMPFEESQSVNHPVSLYAATKKSNELMAHTYSHLYQLPTTGLRFFTVYGPWGRPDMALFKFTKNIIEEKPIDVFNYGKHTRDFTYIDDIVEGIIKTLENPATINVEWNSNQPDPANSNVPWRIYNIGNNKPVLLMDYIKALEKTLGKKAKINLLPLQPGDILDTYANVENLKIKFNYKPVTSVNDGVSKFVKWYKDYFQI